MSSPIWKPNDTIIAKGSRAKVVASDLSDGQNWVRVQYGGQEYEGYQTEFEVKGWRKLDPLMAVVGCGCLTLVGLVVVFGAILSGSNNSPQQQETGGTYQQPAKDSNTGNSSLPVPSPVQRTVKPSPTPLPVQRTVKPLPTPSPVQKVVKPKPSQEPATRAVEPLPVPSPGLSPIQRAVEPSSSPSQSPQPIRASQAGNCECPYDTDRAGRECGGRSAYSRLGGRSGAQCYTSDQ